MTGAEKSIDDIKEYKKSLESIITTDELKIINYQTIQENLDLDFEDHLIERERLQSKKPNVPERIFDLINKFPDDKNFIVKSFFVTNCPDSLADLGKYRAAYNNIKHDLPRGIYMRSLMKKSNAVAEVIYEDNLFGDRVTIDIIELKDNLDLGFPDDEPLTNQNIADYFAELILETGNYVFEDKLNIKLSSFQKLNGYKVTIQPKNNKEYLRTYFCLVSKDSKYLVFSQSTDKTDDEIVEIIEGLGETDGLNSYDEFYNAFYTIPANCGIEDTFISIYSKKLTNDYTRRRGYSKWSKKMVGHWSTTAYFNGEDNNFVLEGRYRNLSSNYRDLTALLPNVLGNSIPSVFTNVGNFRLSGTSIITNSDIDADLKITTELGYVQSDLKLTNIADIDNANYEGNIVLEDFDIGTMLNDPLVGETSLNFDVKFN